MNDYNGNENRVSHACRRPENIVRTSKSSSSARPRAGTKNGGAQIYSSGAVRTPGRRNPSTAVESTNDRRIAKQQNKLVKTEAKRRKAAKSEAEWQKDIVRVRGGIDGVMLAIILILVALGSITVFSASYPLAVKEEGNSMAYIVNQITFVLIGLGLMTLMIFVPMKWYRSWAPIASYVIAVVLLIAVLFIGTEEGVTKRWISLGFVNIQPSEVMKLAITLMLAWYFGKYEERMNDIQLSFWQRYRWNTFYPVCILGLACLLVLVGKHLSGTIIVGMIGFLILVIGGCKLKWLFFTAVPAGAAAITAFLIMNPYALKRITTFTDENADTLDELYQTTQSLYAIGSGGLFGVGLGQSRQKFSYLTAAHTDFIFSIWCEECGFLGAVALIVLFLLFMWRGYVIALRAPDKFTMLTAFGITTHVGIQAFFNMCVAADIFPNTGITLPFFSYGGSSLVVLLFEMGILLAISRQYYMKKSDLRRKA